MVVITSNWREGNHATARVRPSQSKRARRALSSLPGSGLLGIILLLAPVGVFITWGMTALEGRLLKWR